MCPFDQNAIFCGTIIHEVRKENFMGTIRTQLQTDIYENALRYVLLGDESKIKDWYDAGDMAVVLIENNGNKTYYDDTKHTMRILRNLEDVDEECFSMEFRIRLNKIFRFSKWDQKSFAEALDISEHTMCNYMTGKSIPSVYTAFRMTQLLNCSMNELFYID